MSAQMQRSGSRRSRAFAAARELELALYDLGFEVDPRVDQYDGAVNLRMTAGQARDIARAIRGER